MSFSDDVSDYETYERDQLAMDDEEGILCHHRDPGRNTPDADEIMVALNALNLATFQASRHPDDADLLAEELLARVRWERVVWEMGRAER